METCGGLLPIVKVVVSVLKIVTIIIPIALIVYGTIDLGKAVIASDEKEVKAAQKRLIQRFVYAALIFFVPTLVYFLMNTVAANADSRAQTDATSWANCWNAAH